jgi:hypothetical protein
MADALTQNIDAAPSHAHRPVATANSRQVGLLWLATCLLLAGLVGVGGYVGTNRHPTSVAKASSSPRWQTKNIEDLKVGDLVLAWDETTGKQELKPIDRTFRRVADHLRHLTIRAADGSEQTLRTTDDHPFYTIHRGWLPAADLRPGDPLRQPDGQIAHLLATFCEEHTNGVEVFNLRVVDSHTYYAADTRSDAPVLVHNANGFYDDAIKAIQKQMDPWADWLKGSGSGGWLSDAGSAAMEQEVAYHLKPLVEEMKTKLDMPEDWQPPWGTWYPWMDGFDINKFPDPPDLEDIDGL